MLTNTLRLISIQCNLASPRNFAIAVFCNRCLLKCVQSAISNSFYMTTYISKSQGFGGLAVRQLAFHLPSSIPSKVHLNVDSNEVLILKEYCQRSAESRGFSLGAPVSSHRES